MRGDGKLLSVRFRRFDSQYRGTDKILINAFDSLANAPKSAGKGQESSLTCFSLEKHQSYDIHPPTIRACPHYMFVSPWNHVSLLRV